MFNRVKGTSDYITSDIEKRGRNFTWVFSLDWIKLL